MRSPHRAGGDRSLSLLEVRKAVGASPRKPGYCFEEVLGTSPMRDWRAMRPNRDLTLAAIQFGDRDISDAAAGD
ncbi:hypothetical protein [Bradyrhizobium centrosematis]|uniref:hypothetical protein n=1 Tax=Bradyrhizobium centrosematis TaxID=1300039 RepID=UPI00388D162F